MSVATAGLGWAILHFLWQGTLIGVLVAATLELIPRRSSGARYAVGCAALGLCIATFAATFLVMHESIGESRALVVLPAAVDLSHADFAAAAPILAALASPAAEAPASSMSAIAWFWALGALAMAVRLLRAGVWVHRLRCQALTPVEARWQEMVDSLRCELGLRRVVRLMRSELVDGPVVIGWLEPLILVPASTFTALTPDQVRCVLAHELAHVRRYDHLVNALQALVEVSLFFHPVVWWLSRVVRDEREHCCDRVAIDATGSPLALARALTRLESHRLIRPSVALAATDKRGPLMQRIQRILDVPTPRSRRPLGWRAMTALGAAALIACLGLPEAGATPGATPSSRISMEGRDAASDYAIVEGRVLEAVEAGNLSAKDAKRTLAALRKTMLGERDRSPRYIRLRDVDPRDPRAKDDLTRAFDRNQKEAYRFIDPEAIDGSGVAVPDGIIQRLVDDSAVEANVRDTVTRLRLVDEERRSLDGAALKLKQLRQRTRQLEEALRDQEQQLQKGLDRKAPELDATRRNEAKDLLRWGEPVRMDPEVQLRWDREFDRAVDGQTKEGRWKKVEATKRYLEAQKVQKEYELYRKNLEALKQHELREAMRRKQIELLDTREGAYILNEAHKLPEVSEDPGVELFDTRLPDAEVIEVEEQKPADDTGETDRFRFSMTVR